MFMGLDNTEGFYCNSPKPHLVKIKIKLYCLDYLLYDQVTLEFGFSDERFNSKKLK